MTYVHVSRLFWRFLLGACLVFAAGLPAGQARACSVCLAGDPVFSAQGTTAQAEGEISFYMEARGWSKRSAPLPHDEEGEHHEEEGEHHEEEGEHHEEEGHHGREVEKNDSQRVDFYVSWTPIDRFTVTLDLPWAFNKVVEIEGDERLQATEAGFGDLALQTSLILWRDRQILPSTWVEARAFWKFPTGKSKQVVNGLRDPHLQAGTGSWDFGFGLAGAHRLDWGSLYSSVFYRINTEGSLNYEYGDVFLLNLATEVPLGHLLGIRSLDYFTPGLEANYRWAAKDVSNGERFNSSGGSVLYFTPSLRIRLPKFGPIDGPSLRTAVQIPVTSAWLNGFQDEDPLWFVGVGYSF